MKFSHTMDMSAKLKRFFLALSVVLFVGQSVVKAQTEAEVKRLIDIGKYEEAIAMGQKILAQDPKNDKIDYLMGRAYFETDRVNEASAWFTKGQGHSSRNPMNFVGAGAVAAYQDNFEKAKLEPEKPEVEAKNAKQKYTSKDLKRPQEKEEKDSLKGLNLMIGDKKRNSPESIPHRNFTEKRSNTSFKKLIENKSLNLQKNGDAFEVKLN